MEQSAVERLAVVDWMTAIRRLAALALQNWLSANLSAVETAEPVAKSMRDLNWNTAFKRNPVVHSGNSDTPNHQKRGV